MITSVQVAGAIAPTGIAARYQRCPDMECRQLTGGTMTGSCFMQADTAVILFAGRANAAKQVRLAGVVCTPRKNPANRLWQFVGQEGSRFLNKVAGTVAPAGAQRAGARFDVARQRTKYSREEDFAFLSLTSRR